MTTKFRSRYDYSSYQSKGLKCGDSRTKQSFKDECDINNILKKYNKTGQLPDLIKSNPQFGDFSNSLDYVSSLNLVIHAQAQFDALPSHLRSRFHNDPAQFLAFCDDPKNDPELVRLGLATAKKIEEPSAPSQKKPGSPKGAPGPAAGEGPDAQRWDSGHTHLLVVSMPTDSFPKETV